MTRVPQNHKHKRTVPKTSPFQSKCTSSRPSVTFARSPRPYASRSTPTANHNSRSNPNFIDDSIDEAHDSASDDADSDSGIFHWEEEDTLLNDLMDESPEASEDESLDVLVDSLQDVLTDRGKMLKREIVQTLVPTHNHVKIIHKILEDRVEVSYGKGVALFNRTCKDIENTMYAQRSDFVEAYNAKKEKVEILYGDLQVEYAARDQLWLKLNDDLNAILGPMMKIVEDTPAKIERTIAKLEEQWKSMEKANSGKNALAKNLENILKNSGH